MPKEPLDEMFVLIDEKTHQPMINTRYVVVREDGKEYKGVTNEKGEAFRVGAFQGYKIDFFLDNQSPSDEG